MAVPTSAECKLNLSFDMVAKTMTVAVQSVISSQGIDGLSYTIAYGTILDPLGDSVDIDEIYFDGDGGVSSQTFDAPLDSDGKVINGAYKVLLPYVTVDDGTPTTYTNVDSDYTLSYTAPTVCLTADINCISPQFKSTDATDYRVIDPTSQGYITPTTVTYAHDLYYPVTSNGFPTNTTETADLIIKRGSLEFYQGTQTATVSHSLSYTFVDGLVVIDTITGDLETLVDCSTLLCGVTCGLNTLYTTMQANKLINATEYRLNVAKFELLQSKAMLAQMNIDCGNSTQATTIIADIKSELGNCCDDCSAADGTPISGVGV
jgi:hypothetical protein